MLKMRLRINYFSYFFLLTFFCFSCKQNYNQQEAKEIVRLSESVILDGFIYYKEILFTEEYEYPKTIFFKSRINDSIKKAVEKSRKLSNFNECKERLNEQNFDLKFFSSFYEINDNITELAYSKVNLLNITNEPIVSLYSFPERGMILNCKAKWNSRISIIYNEEFISGIINVFEPIPNYGGHFYDIGSE